MNSVALVASVRAGAHNGIEKRKGVHVLLSACTPLHFSTSLCAPGSEVKCTGGINVFTAGQTF